MFGFVLWVTLLLHQCLTQRCTPSWKGRRMCRTRRPSDVDLSEYKFGWCSRGQGRTGVACPGLARFSNPADVCSCFTKASTLGNATLNSISLLTSPCPVHERTSYWGSGVYALKEHLSESPDCLHIRTHHIETGSTSTMIHQRRIITVRVAMISQKFSEALGDLVSAPDDPDGGESQSR